MHPVHAITEPPAADVAIPAPDSTERGGTPSATSASATQAPERTAVHEAGHALAAFLLGGSVDELTIEAGADSNGHTRSSLAGDVEDAEHRLRLALMLAGGMAAECLVFGNHSWGGAYPTTPEREAAATDPVVYFTGERVNGSDASKLATLARSFGFTSAEAVEATVETWIVAAGRMLQEHRGRLMDLTEALLDRGTLRGEEVAASFEEGPPSPVNGHNYGLPSYATDALNLAA